MMYYIISLKYTTKKELVFWRSNDAGYTTIIQQAGIYSEEEVKAQPTYYNNGYETIALPINTEAFHEIGMRVAYHSTNLEKFVRKNRHKEGGQHE